MLLDFKLLRVKLVPENRSGFQGLVNSVVTIQAGYCSN